MTYDEENDEYVLSSGRRFYAFDGILGLNSRDKCAYYGFDGTVNEWGGKSFTTEERYEIAEYMIALWEVWADQK